MFGQGAALSAILGADVKRGRIGVPTLFQGCEFGAGIGAEEDIVMDKIRA